MTKVITITTMEFYVSKIYKISKKIQSEVSEYWPYQTALTFTLFCFALWNFTYIITNIGY